MLGGNDENELVGVEAEDTDEADDVAKDAVDLTVLLGPDFFLVLVVALADTLDLATCCALVEDGRAVGAVGGGGRGIGIATRCKLPACSPPPPPPPPAPMPL